MGELLIIYDLRQHTAKVGSASERQSNTIVTRNRRNKGAV